MKIVILAVFFIDNVEYQENLLVKYYEKYGHEVHLITSTTRTLFDFAMGRLRPEQGEETYKLGRATIYRLRYAINVANRLQRLRAITPILNRVKPDLIFVRDAMLNLTECVSYAHRHPNCKIVMDSHSDFSNSAKTFLSRNILHGIIKKWMVRWARPHLSRIFPVTPGTARFLHLTYGIPYDEMELLPLGADIDAGRAIRESGARAALRHAYDIHPDTIVMFTGGKLMPVRRTEALIEAFKKLPQDKVYLIVVGESPPEHIGYKEMLQQLSEGHDNIRFVGWLKPDDIYRHFDLSDIAVFPASQSILWQQAISMGLPLVVGDLVNGEQDVSYLNTHDNILVADNSVSLEEGLRSKLMTLISDNELRRKMAKGAEQVTSTLLDWNVLIHRTLRFAEGPSHSGMEANSHMVEQDLRPG